MNIKAIIKKNQGVVFCYLIALVLFAGFSVYMPGFARLSHIRTVFLESALIGIVALGQTLVVITGVLFASIVVARECLNVWAPRFRHLRSIPAFSKFL